MRIYKCVPIAVRFWSKVHKQPGGCWLWVGATNSDGYGKLWNGHKTTDAHRVSWEISNGPVPAGMCVLHKCDNPPCIRPSHLFLGSNQENSLDMKRKGRSASGARNSHCILTPDDVRFIRTSPLKATPLRKMFGVSDGAIRSIREGRSWKHLNKGQKRVVNQKENRS